jgi:hypothetical protein
MLHTELLRLINSRDTWALIGSGPSTEAGCPTWDQLSSQALSSLDSRQLASLHSDPLFIQAQRRGDLPATFTAIETFIGRDALEASIRNSLQTVGARPASLHQLLADLPFAGYLTTNYDDLLERALNHVDPGWTAVGNVGDEVRKASGTAKRVVWHIHGAASLDSSRSRLVITEEDYDQIYLDESRVFQQLKGLLANRRIIIIGFGFRDQRMIQLLHSVGRLTDATRPIYALVERVGEFKHSIDRQVFLRANKIDVHPYRNEDGQHRNLRHTLSVYNALSLRRSLRFGRHLNAPPSYDPETTGLLIYNDLVLNAPREVPHELRTSILRARVLSVCETGPRTREQLTDDLNGILEALTRRIVLSISGGESQKALSDALKKLVDDDLLINSRGLYSLSNAGRETVLDHAAAAGRMEEQFTASIRARCEQTVIPLGVKADHPTEVVCAFFREAIERRALGVALAFATGGTPTQQDYHALALLQSIGQWLDAANGEAEALSVIQTIQEIFREPSEPESAYIATAVQARFVLHLLSLDNDTLTIRMKELKDSLFIMDASSLIPWLASGSAGSESAQTLIQRLQESSAIVVTTLALVEELAEHVRWAQKKVRPAGGMQNLAVFQAAAGWAGNKTNAFLQGWRSLYGYDVSPRSFDEYLARCLGIREVSNPVTNAEVSDALSARHVKVLDYEALVADEPGLGPAREEYIRQVEARRVAGSSFTHGRQVRAEAEAIALVEQARAGTFNSCGIVASNGFFVSNTSMLNQVAKSSVPITMRPEAARAWLATIRPAAADDVRALMSELLWELQERQMDLVDRQSLLHTFGPLIAAARERLEEVLPKYQTLIAQRYGGAWVTPNIGDLDAPVVLDNILYERVSDLEQKLDRQQSELEEAVKAAERGAAAKAELDKIKAEEQKRQKYLRRTSRKSTGKKRRH